MSKPIFKQYEDDENLMFVLKFPITVNFENDDISTYQGEYSSLIPMEREVKALKKILEFMEQDDILCKKFEDEISSLWGFYDISKGSRDIFFEEAKKHQEFKIAIKDGSMTAEQQREQKHRLQISIDKNRYEEIKAAAEKQGVSVSVWLDIAIAEKLQRIRRKYDRT